MQALKMKIDKINLLQAGPVSLKDQQDLLRYQSQQITKHYNPKEIKHLVDAANIVYHRQISTPRLNLIRTNLQSLTAKDKMQSKKIVLFTIIADNIICKNTSHASQRCAPGRLLYDLQRGKNLKF